MSFITARLYCGAEISGKFFFVRDGRLFKDVNQRDGRFGDAPIVFMGVGDACTALCALEFVVVKVDISSSEFGLHAPTAGKHPLIAHTKTSTDIPAFIAMVLQSFDESEGEFDITGIEASAQGMRCEKPAIEAFASPVAELRLHQDVLQFGIVLEVKRIEPHLKIEGGLSSGAQLQTQVGRCGGIVEEIVFQDNLLCMAVEGKPRKENEEETPFFHCSRKCHIWDDVFETCVSYFFVSVAKIECFSISQTNFIKKKPYKSKI